MGAPYWINKFFLSRINENDQRADKMEKITQTLLKDKQFVNGVKETLTSTERPSYFAELENILTAKQNLTKCVETSMEKLSSSENEIYSVKECDDLYDIDAEYDPFDAFEMDDFEYLDKEFQESIDSATKASKESRTLMPCSELMNTLMFVDENQTNHSFLS